MVGTRVWDDTSTTSYFHVVSSLDASTVVSRGDALEVSGAAKLYSIAGAGWFAVGGGEEPTITRYSVSAAGRLEEQERIQPQGVHSLWDTLYVVSPTRCTIPTARTNSSSSSTRRR